MVVIVYLSNKRFSVLSTVLEHGRVVSSTQKTFRARDEVECSNVFLITANNPGVLKNSTEHSKPLFLTLRQFPYMSLLAAVHHYGL